MDDDDDEDHGDDSGGGGSGNLNPLLSFLSWASWVIIFRRVGGGVRRVRTNPL